MTRSLTGLPVPPMESDWAKRHFDRHGRYIGTIRPPGQPMDFGDAFYEREVEPYVRQAYGPPPTRKADAMDEGKFAERLGTAIGTALSAAQRRSSPPYSAQAGESPAPNNRRRFELTGFGDVQLNTTAAYLVRNIVPAQGLIVVWGPPKCGKSFWTLDVILHIACGWEYRQHRVTQGLVVYVGCEGEFAIPARIEALRQTKIAEGAESPAFHLILTRLAFASDVDQLISDIRAQLGTDTPAVMVIDTLNRSIEGSESSDEDMSNYVKAVDKLREAFECAVIIIHHCGINDARPRGHTSLTGAADAQIAVKKDAAGIITTTVEFLKDGPEGGVTTSRLKVVEVGTDDEGEIITSCVIEEIEGETAPKAKPKSAEPKLSAKHQLALNALIKAIGKDSAPPPSCNDIPASARVVTVDLWRRCYNAMVPAENDQEKDARRQAFHRAREALQAGPSPIIQIWNDLAWIPGSRA